MAESTTSFLDRIQEQARITDRSRAADGVRAVFYAILAEAGDEEADRCAELLPPGLETLWKPSYYQALGEGGRDPAAGGDAEPAPDPVEIVRSRLVGCDREEAERLTAAVADALKSAVDEGAWRRLTRSLPEGVAGTF